MTSPITNMTPPITNMTSPISISKVWKAFIYAGSQTSLKICIIFLYYTSLLWNHIKISLQTATTSAPNRTPIELFASRRFVVLLSFVQYHLRRKKWNSKIITPSAYPVSNKKSLHHAKVLK